jgi:hypothetical protein
MRKGLPTWVRLLLMALFAAVVVLAFRTFSK